MFQRDFEASSYSRPLFRPGRNSLDCLAIRLHEMNCNQAAIGVETTHACIKNHIIFCYYCHYPHLLHIYCHFFVYLFIHTCIHKSLVSPHFQIAKRTPRFRSNFQRSRIFSNAAGEFGSLVISGCKKSGVVTIHWWCAVVIVGSNWGYWMKKIWLSFKLGHGVMEGRSLVSVEKKTHCVWMRKRASWGSAILRQLCVFWCGSVPQMFAVRSVPAKGTIWGPISS